MSMKRLSGREITLLFILLALVITGGYLTLFYMPMEEKKASLETGIVQIQEELSDARLKLAAQTQMQKELEEIFSGDSEPVSIAAYDNLQSVIFELHEVLEQTEEYSLNFSSVDTEESIVQREIALTFHASNYEEAECILKQLHDSKYRCMLDSLDIRVADDAASAVDVSATIIYFEYITKE